MAAVQVEQATIDAAAQSYEDLATAVESFLSTNPQIPQANLDALNQALTDGAQAKTDLAAHASSA